METVDPFQRRPDPVADGRAQIDAVDAELIRLVGQRAAVSRAIQAARAAEGGPRLVHSREGEVVERWRAAFGPSGAMIAAALLELCRGTAD